MEIDHGKELISGDDVHAFLGREFRFNECVDFFCFDGEKAREVMQLASSSQKIADLLFLVNQRATHRARDIVKYREELYKFISKLLDADYYRNVLIPFYLSKTDEADESGTSSFLHRLTSSDNIQLRLEDYSPEFLAREFSAAQNDFISRVIAPFSKNE